MKNGFHDSFRSRKWWGMLLAMSLLTWGALHLQLAVLGIYMPAVITTYGIYCGLNLMEKAVGTGGVLRGLGFLKGEAGEDSKGKEDEV